jgi:biopolymer transport protein ExbD
MRADLVKAKETQEAAAEINDREFTGKVVILADRRTPYRVLMDILVTCGQSGFGEFKFVIVKESG